MSMRKRVNSGTAKGAPRNSSNARTNEDPPRTDARNAATNASALMEGRRLVLSSTRSSLQPAPTPPSCTPRNATWHQTRQRTSNRAIGRSLQNAFRFSHIHTAIAANIAEQHSQAPIMHSTCPRSPSNAG